MTSKKNTERWVKCTVRVDEFFCKLTLNQYNSGVMILLNGNPYYMTQSMIGEELTSFHMYMYNEGIPYEGCYCIDDNGIFGPYEEGDVLVNKCHGVIFASNDSIWDNIPRSFIDEYFLVGRPKEVYVLFEELEPNKFIPKIEHKFIEIKTK